ncbi:Placenta-specific -like protein [Echinococcus granulosus]|uniref:Placenta-specific gene 8 protein n=1 Tax=Echinococcus granulosus TaxID=6210 RepID=W6UJ83_ECHGR|nr:Placenta-specific gene 8 protein [Echinococcus granulosus]EUB61545.1 Placenta-specific gene 8 protein [Echinococcus granulosus]KAH9280082.1 Placenta-specific -like protein [Echinococcus granulosus]
MPASSSGSEGDHENRAREAEREREEKQDRPVANGDVVITQPSDRQLRDWHDDLCSCHKDIGNCFLVAFCPLCAAAYEFHEHNENPFLGFCFTAPLMALVAQYRLKNGIMGSLCTDCLATYFCGCCMLCRLHRDFRHSSI